MTVEASADEYGLVGRDRVIQVVQEMLRDARTMGWKDDQIAARARMKDRLIKAYRHEEKVPNLAAALSIAAVLGDWAVSRITGLIGYSASANDEADRLQPNAIVAELAGGMAIIAGAAADGRFDHTEMPAVTNAADQIIATVLPLSRAGRGDN